MSQAGVVDGTCPLDSGVSPLLQGDGIRRQGLREVTGMGGVDPQEWDEQAFGGVTGELASSLLSATWGSKEKLAIHNPEELLQDTRPASTLLASLKL